MFDRVSCYVGAPAVALKLEISGGGHQFRRPIFPNGVADHVKVYCSFNP